MAASFLCSAIGVALGGPTDFTPCNKDATHQCAVPCTPFGAIWIASSDATQVPYCSTTGTVSCNPSATYIPCVGNTYTNATCTAGQKMTGIPKAACK